MKTLITGHCGFVGRNFLRFGLPGDVTAIDINGHNPIDARDFFRVDDTHFDLVIHLAAVVGGRALIEGSPLSLAVDLSIDAEMAQWAMRTRPGHILYFSSSAAYPVSLQTGEQKRWLQESDIHLANMKTPDLVYGWAKLTGEMLMENLRREGLSVTTLRPFSGYGTDQSLDYPFPSLIARGRRKEDPFTIWGSDQTVRDWIHINDIVRISLVMAAQRVNEAVNLCTGKPTSFRQLVEIIAEQVGYQPEILADATQPKGVAYRVGDPMRMLEYDWPMISIEEGVARALDGRSGVQ